MRALSALCLVPLLSACAFVLHDGDFRRVNGVLLDETHVETLEIGSFTTEGLHLDVDVADVRIEPTDGPSSLEVTLHESEPLDASASFAQGKLNVSTRSGRPAQVGRVLVRANGPLAQLSVETGVGDVVTHGVPIAGHVHLSSGTGDVTLEQAGTPARVVLSTGVGDLRARAFDCEAVELTTGTGDVSLADVRARKAALTSGVGDVELMRSNIEDVQAYTGVGDVRCSATAYTTGKLDVDAGSVRRD